MTTEKRSLDIIIVGGGLAGLAAAGYLRVQHNVTVLERWPLDFKMNTRGDYGMSIVVNAYKLLAAQGVSDENLQAVRFTHLWNCSKDNTARRTAPFDTAERYGAPSVFTRRARLQAELYRFATDPTRAGSPARVLGGVTISTLDPDAGTLTTAAGETFSADLIVGADGLNSFVRGILAPDAHPVPTGLVAYITSVPASFVEADPGLEFQSAQGVGGICVWEDGARRVLCYPCDRGDAKYFQVVAYTAEGAWAEEFDKTGSAIVQDVPLVRLLEEFKDFHPSVLGLLSHAPTVAVWRIRDIEALHSWVKGKTVLIGDAAHAVTPHVGQGCNIAIEDAEALGFLLRDTAGPEDVASRLARFEKLRMERAHHVQFSSRQVGGVLRGAQKDNVGSFDRAAFAQMIYGYGGAEEAQKAQLVEQK
ncbi:hypothetical protein HWV62_2225 [Athelia sp. TMB]|nr:hypothetical protein HWV62_2225 [Athelia sp. TMB]